MTLRGRYLPACAVALLGLVPNVVLSTALLPLQHDLQRSLHTGALGIAIASGVSGAGYAIGAVLAAQIALRVMQRRIFLVSEAGFVLATLVAAAAPDAGVFVAARLVQGLTAGGMLISSLPPLLTRFGSRRVPLSAAIVDVGIFGASTLGPLIGPHAVGHDGWRWLLLVTAAVGAAGFVVALASYDRWEAPDPDRRVDRTAHVLVVVTAGAVFAASSIVGTLPVLSVTVTGLFAVALVALVVLLVVEARHPEPLVPVQALATQLPVSGILAAMAGGAVFVTVTEILQSRLGDGAPALLWPMVPGALVGAALLGLLFATRWLPVLVDLGMCALGVGALLVALSLGHGSVLAAALLLGFGAAATVSPGLFLAGLGLPSERLGRAFALVQLLRAMATYAVAPVVLQAAVKGAGPSGARSALLAMSWVSAGALLLLLLVPLVSGARLRAPDLEAWLDGEKGLPSPATATHLRPAVEDEDAEPLLPEAIRRHRHG
jgi:MFS family permease